MMKILKPDSPITEANNKHVYHMLDEDIILTFKEFKDDYMSNDGLISPEWRWSFYDAKVHPISIALYSKIVNDYISFVER